MVRVITQETYDEVVKENIEEFDMTPQDAISEAIAQFEAQGVNLTNIIKDLALNSSDDHLVSTTLANLKNLKWDTDGQKIIELLKIVKVECDKGIAYRVMAGKNGAYELLISFLEASFKEYQKDKLDKEAEFIIQCLNTLVSLMDVQPDLLEDKGLDLIKSILDTVKDDSILIPTLRWCCVCSINHEMNRQALFKRNIVANVKALIREAKNRKLLSETMQLVRKLTLDDDVRVQIGKAHDHARELGTQLLEDLAALLKDNSKPPLVSELMVTIATLLVRNELCAAVSDSVDVLMCVMTDNYDNVTVAQQGYKLITALAGNDDVKRRLINCGMAPVIVSLLNRHMSNATATALALKCIAALALRCPSHGEQFMEAGAADALVSAMKVHPDSSEVQKNACWAIRNIVARSNDQNPKFHELGVESLLNQAYDRFSNDFGYDIKSALRDLKCEVKLEEQWTGKGVEIAQ